MLKIFTTQLLGVFQKIAENDVEIEEASRGLAQSIISGGSVYFHGFKEMEAISYEAVEGKEPFRNAIYFKNIRDYDELELQDSIVLATRYSSDLEALEIANELKQRGIKTVGISTVVQQEPSLSDIADFHIDLQTIDPLVPFEDGKRIGYPASMSGLFAYFALYLTTTEILYEFENE